MEITRNLPNISRNFQIPKNLGNIPISSFKTDILENQIQAY